MNCLACRSRLGPNELIRCSTCLGCYHYKCFNITPEEYKSIQINKKWRCQDCVNITRRKNDDSTPVRSAVDCRLAGGVADMSCDESITLEYGNSATETPGNHNICSLEQLSCLLDSKLEVIRVSILGDIKTTIRNEINTAISSIRTEFTATTDQLKSDINNLDTKIHKLEAENSTLRAELENTRRNLISIDKLNRNRNLEIQNVTEKREESLTAIVKKICETVEFPIKESDLYSVRRIARRNPLSNRPRNIILTLPSERSRDTLISAFKRYNKQNRSNLLNTTTLNIAGETRTVYLSEHLTPDCKELHSATRKAAKDLSYKYVWVKFGRIYVRKNDSAPPILIRDMTCLKKLQ